jgi:hypothetical protein
MTTTSLLNDLRRLSVDVTAKGDKLVVHAPKGVLTPEMRARIAEQKVALLALLSTRPGCSDASEIEEKEESTAFRPGETPEPFDILPTDTSGGFPHPHERGFLLPWRRPSLILSRFGLTSPPQADTASPAAYTLSPSAKTDLAALISRSW